MKKRQLLIAATHSFLILILSTGCSTLLTKVAPSQEYTTDSGFQFAFRYRETGVQVPNKKNNI